MLNFIQKHKIIIGYSAAAAVIFLWLKIIEYKLLIVDHSSDVYTGCIALLFLLLGMWLSRKVWAPKKEIQIVETERIVERETIVEKEVFITAPLTFMINQKALEETELSTRELDVLQLIAKGMSNHEIAAELFVSVNTIKTHIANLFCKLDVSRRTQAVEKAKQLSLIP